MGGVSETLSPELSRNPLQRQHLAHLPALPALRPSVYAAPCWPMLPPSGPLPALAGRGRGAGGVGRGPCQRANVGVCHFDTL